MTLNLGTLSYEIDADTSGFDKKLGKATAQVEAFDKATERASGKKIDVTPTGGKQLDSAAKSAEGLGKAADKAAGSAGKIQVPSSVVSQLASATSSARGLGDELDRAASSASKMGSSASGIGGMEGVLGKAVSTAKSLAPTITAAAAATTVFAKGWGRFTAIDDAQFKLKGLGHDAQAVADIMASSNASVKGTAFGLGEAASAAANAVASGIKPGQELTQVLTTVTDTAAIAGASMSDMGMIFNSIAARGKLQGDDLLQLLGRGVPVLQLLSNELGVTAAEVSDMVSEGKIDFATFESAMRSGMGGAAKEMGNSVTGSLANVQAAIGRLGEAIISPVMKEGPEVISGLTDGINILTSAVKATIGVWEDVPGPVKTVVASLVAAKVITSTLGPMMGTQLAGGATKVVDAFKSGVSGITTFGSSLKEAYGYAKLAHPEMGTLGASMSVLAGQGGVASAAMGGLKGAASGLLGALGGPWGLALAGATAALGLFMGHVQKTKQAQEEAKASTQTWADIFSEAEGKLSKAAQDQALQVVKDANISEVMDKAGVSYGEAANAVLDLSGSYDEMMTRLDGVIEKNTVIQNTDTFGQQGREIEALNSTGHAAQDLKDRLAELHQQQTDGAAAAEESATAQSELAAKVAEAARAGEDSAPKYHDLNAILGTLSDEAKTVDDAIKNMANAMMGLSDDPAVRLQGYLGESAAAIQQLKEQLANGFGGLDDTGMFDEWDAQGRTLQDTMSDVRESMYQAAAASYELSIQEGQTGVEASQTAADAAREHVDALKETLSAAGMADDKIQGLIDRYGLVPDEIMTEIHTAGADTATALMDGIDERLARVDAEQATIVVDSTALSLTKEELEELGYSMEDLGNGTVQIKANTDIAKEAIGEVGRLTKDLGTDDNTIVFRADQQEVVDAFNEVEGFKSYVETNPARMRLLADTEESHRALEELGVEAQTLPNGYLWVDDNSPDVMGKLANLGADVAALPEGNVVIYDSTPENISALQRLGVETTTLPGGRVVITDNAADTRRNINRNLSSEFLNKTGTVTMNIIRNIRNVFSSSNMDGGRIPGHMDGGALPRNASGNVADSSARPRHSGYRLRRGGPGSNKRDGILGMTPEGIPVSWLDAGEWITNRDASEQYDGTLYAMNSGASAREVLAALLRDLPANASGGKTAEVLEQLSGFDGGPYVMGGFSPSAFDCSGAVSAGVNTWLGLDPFDSRMSTVTEGNWLANKGFEPGRGSGSDLVVGWYDYGGGANGHTAMMFPDGTYLESGGNTGQGFTIGGPAGPLDGRGFTNFMYLPGSGEEEESGGELTGDGGVTIGGNGTDIPDLASVQSMTSRSKRPSWENVEAPGTAAGGFNVPGLASNKPGASVRSSLGGSRAGQFKAMADSYGYGREAEAVLNMDNPFVGQRSWGEAIGEPGKNQILDLAKQLEAQLGRGGIQAQVEAALNAKTPNWDVWLRVNDDTLAAFNALGKAKEDRENAALDITEAEEKLAAARKESLKSDEDASESLADAYKALEDAKKTDSIDSARETKDADQRAKKVQEAEEKRADSIAKAEKKIQELKEKSSDNEVKAANNIAEAESELEDARDAEKRAIEAVKAAQMEYNAQLQAAPIKAASEFVNVIATSMDKLGSSLSTMAENLEYVNEVIDRQIDAEGNSASAKLDLIQKEADLRKLQRENTAARHDEVLQQQQAEYDLAIARDTHIKEHSNAEVNLSELRQQGILNVSQLATSTDRSTILSASTVATAELALEVARAQANKNEYDRYVALEQSTYELAYMQEVAKIESERLALASAELADAAAAAAGKLGGSASALAKEQEGQQRKTSGVGKIIGGLATGAAAIALFMSGAGIPAALAMGAPAIGALSGGVSDVLTGKAQEDAYKEEAKKEYDQLSDKDKALVDTARAGTWVGALAGAGVGLAGGNADAVGSTVGGVSSIFNIPLEYEMNKQKYGAEAADLIRSKQEAELARREKQAEIEKTRKEIELAEETGAQTDKLEEILATLEAQLSEHEQENKQLAGVNDKLDSKSQSVLMSIGGSGWGADSSAGMWLGANSGGFGGVTEGEVGEWSSLAVENGWSNITKGRPVVPYAGEFGDDASSGGYIEGLPETVVEGLYAKQLVSSPQVPGAIDVATGARLQEQFVQQSSDLSAAAQRLLEVYGGTGDATTIGTQFTGPVTIEGRDADDTLSSLRRELAQR